MMKSLDPLLTKINQKPLQDESIEKAEKMEAIKKSSGFNKLQKDILSADVLMSCGSPEAVVRDDALQKRRLSHSKTAAVI